MDETRQVDVYVAPRAKGFETMVRLRYHDSYLIGDDLAELLGRTVLLESKGVSEPLSFVFHFAPKLRG